MRIFFDTEFLEDGHTIDLISVGLVREDGATLYLESAEFQRSHMDDWLKQHVLPHLVRDTQDYSVRKMRWEIAAAIREFVGERPQFWAYYCSYDWVALCQLYGKMLDLPKSWPMYCWDLKVLMNTHGFQLAESDKQPPLEQHHALNDALWCKKMYDKIHVRGVR